MIPHNQITLRHLEMIDLCIDRMPTLSENPPFAQDLFCRAINPILSEVLGIPEQNLLTVNYAQSADVPLAQFIRNSLEQFPILEKIVPQLKRDLNVEALPSIALQRNFQNSQTALSLVPVVSSSQAASNSLRIATAPSYTNVLNRISWFFRNNKEKEALEELDLLPEDLKTEVYFAHYTICNKPTDYTGDFGKDSLLGKAGNRNSALSMRACAIELCRPLFALKEILILLETNDLEKVRELFTALPIAIQTEVLGCYWEACAKPMGYSSDFARDSFLGLNVEKVAAFLLSQSKQRAFPETRAEAVNSYLAFFNFRNRLEKLCARTQKEINNWIIIDTTPSSILSGQQKNMKKKESFASFAEEILSLIGHEFTDITVLTTSKDTDGPATLVGIYLNKYPSLRPFCLLLRPDFRFDDKLLERITGGK